MKENNKVILTTFTDPMMGLSYECEPIFRKLETHFSGRITFRYVMSGLVRDVYTLVDPLDLAKSKELAIKNYNQRLAKIYEREEAISGMPINMEGFCLFDTEHTSSLPLNLAYKAAQLADEEKADRFLYQLRYATIVDCRPTTRREEILDVVRKTHIDERDFLRHFDGETASKALEQDLKCTQTLDIYSLPAYLMEYQGRELLIQSLLDYSTFVSAIEKISNENINPISVQPTQEKLRKLLNHHPVISPIEIKEAFDLPDIDAVQELIRPLLEEGCILIRNVPHGWFIEKKR